jgi:mono/diheme cytochrome c family protein
MFKNKYLHNTYRIITLTTCGAALTLALVNSPGTHAQDNKASPRERAGAVVFGQHCSACHGVRLMKEDAAYDLVAAVKDNMSEALFIRGAKTARCTMPRFDGLLKDTELADVYAYVKRGHTPDLNDVRMESSH